MNNASIIFFGTSTFGLLALEWILKNTNLLAVVTTPDRPAGRKMELKHSPVKEWAVQKGVRLLQPERLKENQFLNELKSCGAEAGVLASYGKIVPQEVLEVFPKGIVNIHPSLLPKLRGATPVQSAILDGLKITGVSLMLMDKDLDHGPIIAQAACEISDDDTNLTLHDKLARVSVGLIEENFEKYLSGKIEPKKQNHQQATFTKLLTKEDGKIDWTEPAQAIERRVRAMVPWPVAWSRSNIGPVKIFKANVSGENLPPRHTELKQGRLLVGTGSTALDVLELQLPGAKKAATSEFLRGLRGEFIFT